MRSMNKNKEELDKLDKLILKELTKDARQSYRKIAEKLKISVGTAQNRIIKLEQKGIIKKYKATLDYEKLGYKVAAIIALCVDRKKLNEVEKKLSKIPNVFGLYEVTGEFDVFASVRFKDMRELDNFIREELSDEAITKTVTFLILRTIKEGHTFLR